MPDIVDVDAAYLECLDLRHPWKWVTDRVLSADRRSGEVRVIERELACQRCEKKRFDTFAVPSFDLLSRRYTGPSRYRMPTSEPGRRRSVQDVRRELWRRQGGGR